jgi:hypothetical protein
MKFEKYSGSIVISEEVHDAIKSIIHSDTISAKFKNHQIAMTARNLIKNGADSGLEDAKPKKGSSRAVYFPSEPKKIVIDGKEAHMPTALKIAFPGDLDSYTGHHELLGEMQNRVESDHFTRNTFGILRETGDGKFETNHENGILAPVVSSHGDDGNDKHHWIEMGKISKFGAGDFRRLTKNENFPNGISHQEFFDAINREHAHAHGRGHYSEYSDDHLDKVIEHPLVEKALDVAQTTGMQPVDLNKSNMGIWKHPHTGEEHIVISDYGYDKSIEKQYTAARRKKYNRY